MHVIQKAKGVHKCEQLLEVNLVRQHGAKTGQRRDNDSGQLWKLLIGPTDMTKKRKYKTSAMKPRGARRFT